MNNENQKNVFDKAPRCGASHNKGAYDKVVAKSGPMCWGCPPPHPWTLVHHKARGETKHI